MEEKQALEAQEQFNFLYIEEATAEGGESRRINFRTSQTVEALKRLIAAELRIPQDWSKIDLVSAGTELTDVGETLDSYGVFDGDIVFYARDTTTTVRPPAYSPPTNAGVKTLDNVMFKDLHGKTLTLHGVPITWTVKQLRNKLGVEKHLSDQVADYRFIYNGKQLVDENNLDVYQLREGCTIQIVLRLPGGIDGLVPRNLVSTAWTIVVVIDMGFLGKSRQEKQDEIEINRLRQALKSQAAELEGVKYLVQDLQQRYDDEVLRSKSREMQYAETIKSLRQKLALVKMDDLVISENEAIAIAQSQGREIQHLEAQVRENNKTITEKDERIQVETVRHARVSRTYQECQTQLANTTARLERTETENISNARDREREKAIFELQRTTFNRRIGNLEKEREQLRDIESKLHQELQKTRRYVKESQDRTKALHMHVRNVSAQNEQLKARDSEMDRVLSDAKEYAQRAEGHAHDLTMKIGELEKEQKSLREIELWLRENLQFCRVKIMDLEGSKQEDQERYDECKREKDSIQGQLDAAARQAAQVQQELGQVTQDLSTARLNLNQTRSQLNSETRKSQNIAQEKAVRDQRIEILQQECSRMHWRLVQLGKQD